MALILKVLNALEPVVVSSLHAKIGVQLACKQLRKVKVDGGGIQSNTDIAHNWACCKQTKYISTTLINIQVFYFLIILTFLPSLK